MSENERTTSHETVDAFNDTCPVGTPVLAFPGSREGRALMTRTRSVAWSLGHEPVVMVEGYAGGIALTHVEVLPMNESAPDPTAGERCPTCGLFCEEPDEPIQPGDYYTVDPTSSTRCPSCGLVPARGSEGAARVAAARRRATPPADDASTELSEGLTEAERNVGAEILAGVRCLSVHQQVGGAWCVNCWSWAVTIGEPVWREHLATYSAAAATKARAEAIEPLIVLDGLLRHWETNPAYRKGTAAAEIRTALGEHLASAVRSRA